jgi:hypothetical protein
LRTWHRCARVQLHANAAGMHVMRRIHAVWPEQN